MLLATLEVQERLSSYGSLLPASTPISKIVDSDKEFAKTLMTSVATPVGTSELLSAIDNNESHASVLSAVNKAIDSQAIVISEMLGTSREKLSLWPFSLKYSLAPFLPHFLVMLLAYVIASVSCFFAYKAISMWYSSRLTKGIA